MQPKNFIMQYDTFNEEFNSLTLLELQVLLESQLIEMKPIDQTQIQSQHQLLIYFHQLQQNQNQNTNQLQNTLLQLCTYLLNDEFKNKKTHQKQHKGQVNQITEKSERKRKFSESSQDHDHLQVYNDESKLLCPQIYERIHLHFPHAYQLINPSKVPQFNFSHSSNILDLITIELQILQNFTSPNQIIPIIQNIVLPIIYFHPDFSVKGVETIMTVMNYFGKDQVKKAEVIKNLSEIVTSLCLSLNETHQTLTIQQIISLMTAIQAIHSTSETYHPSLQKSKLFHTFIKKMLMCSNVESKTANSIAANIYGALLKQLNLYCNEAEMFINLYSTLRCFGSHLVKDIWQLFYDFIEIEGNDIVFTKAELIDIIFYKIEHHENANVVKHCIQSILEQERSFILFNKVPDAIFNSLIRILNYGMHYLDCLFHMDSKMFPMISNFFSSFFNNFHICKEEDFENLIRLFLKAIYQKITFDHALVAMLHSFTLINRKSKAICKEEIEQISQLVRKYYVKYPIRKKHQMMNGICYLLQKHLNSQKKRKDEKQPKSTDLIDLPYLVKNCLNHFPEDYILLKCNGEAKKHQIYQIISQNFTKEEINQTLSIYSLKIKEILNQPTISQQSFCILVQTLKSIQFILYLTEQQENDEKGQKTQNNFGHFQIQTIDSLRDVYFSICERFVTDLGESLYKGKQERLHGINVQNICFNKVFAIKKIIHEFDPCNFIEKALTNVSLLVKDCIEADSKAILSKEDLKTCQYIVKKCFEMIYEFSREEDKQREEKACRLGSQFLEWATDNIQHSECHLLILTALKTRINQSGIFLIEYIEESIYKIFWSLFALESKIQSSQKQQIQNNQQIISPKKLQQISPLYRLRLLTLCGSILFYDDNEVRKFYPFVISNIGEISDRYDFQNLDEIFYLVQLIYTCQETAVDKRIRQEFLSDSSETYARVSRIINSIIETMLNSLNYGVDSKEVIACTNCILNIMFDFASKFNHFSPELIELSIRTLQIGQEYWMFERMLTFKTIQNLSIMLEKQNKISYKGLYPLLSKILCIQEYRGYDSTVALETELRKEEFYTQLKLILLKEADYEGLTCRLALIQLVTSLVEYSMANAQNHHQNHSLDQFLQEFFVFLFQENIKQTNEKMFLTGEHKTKLKHWQCILAYHPEWMIQTCKNQQNWLNFTVQELIIQTIYIVDKNNNLFEVKYYIELFLMKLMISEHSQKIISERVLNLLSDKLLELTSQVNKNVSFIFISGSLMNFLFRTYQITKTHPLYLSLQKLYNAILIYSCSHVAYFRGLSQYFCLERLFVDSEYTRILHQVIGKDADTILLKNKLNTIVNEYYDEIQYWNIRNNLFKQLPTLNGNIVSETFYMDRLKKLGLELLRQIRAEIGFLPYKQIWLEAVKSLNLTSNIEIDIEKASLNANNPEQAIFQRKIDPSLDFIYFSKTKLEGFDMKILITGSKSIPIYGHLSRTGQIFGLSELIIPYQEIVDDQQFKNVACTAEKWLNISWFSNKQEAENRNKFQLSLEKELIAQKQKRYAFFLLKKHQNLDEQLLKQQLDKIQSINKILLILDSQNYLPSSLESHLQGKICFGKYFSQHVEASIFIWEYFKQVYDKKFRTPELAV